MRLKFVLPIAALFALLAAMVVTVPASAAKPPEFSVTTTTATVTEGVDSYASFTISRPDTANKLVTVLFSTVPSGSSPASTSEFEQITDRQVTFAGADTSYPAINVAIYHDSAALHSPVTFVGQIKPYKGSKVNTATATVTINDNLVVNGGFESALSTGWSTSGSGTHSEGVSTTVHYSGSQSASLTITGQGTLAQITQFVTLPSSPVAQLHFAYNATLLTGSDWVYVLLNHNVVAAIYSGVAGWTQSTTIPLTSYAGLTDVPLEVILQSSYSTGSSVYFDNFVITAGA